MDDPLKTILLLSAQCTKLTIQTILKGSVMFRRQYSHQDMHFSRASAFLRYSAKSYLIAKTRIVFRIEPAVNVIHSLPSRMNQRTYLVSHWRLFQRTERSTLGNFRTFQQGPEILGDSRLSQSEYF